MEKIIALRNEIDLLDDQIMKLLERRFTCALEIGHLKKASSAQVLDQKREEIILNKINSFSHNQAIYQVYLTLLETSKNLQRKL